MVVRTIFHGSSVYVIDHLAACVHYSCIKNKNIKTFCPNFHNLHASHSIGKIKVSKLDAPLNHKVSTLQQIIQRCAYVYILTGIN